MHQRGLPIAFLQHILDGGGHKIDHQSLVDGVRELGAVLNHDHIGGSSSVFAAQLGINLLILQVVGFNGDSVKRGKIFRRGRNPAGISVHDEGAALRHGFFCQLFTGHRLARFHIRAYIRTGGSGAQ